MRPYNYYIADSHTNLNDFVAISLASTDSYCSSPTLYGLRKNRTVVTGNNELDWNNIVVIDTIGLRVDGTVAIDGSSSNSDVISKVSHWNDTIAFATGVSHVVRLKKDGTVIAVGDKKYGRCNVSERNLL